MFNGEKLKNLRKSKNLLQSDIAKKLNVSTSAVGMWELLFSTIMKLTLDFQGFCYI